MSRRRIAVAVGLVVVAALAAGVARAVLIPDAAGFVHACVKQKNGQLRIVDTAAACQKSEAALDWRQVGATGPQGPQGPPGPQGSKGPAGDPGADGLGVTGYQIVTDTGTTAQDGQVVDGSAAAVCPQLTTLVGGGYELPFKADAFVKTSVASYSLFGDEWTVTVWGASGVSFTAYAICVDQQPLEGS